MASSKIIFVVCILFAISLHISSEVSARHLTESYNTNYVEESKSLGKRYPPPEPFYSPGVRSGPVDPSYPPFKKEGLRN